MSLFLLSGVVISIFFAVMYFVGLMRKDNSVLDISWGIGFVLVSVMTLFASGSLSLPKILLTSLIILWGTRLAIYISIRNYGKGEDYRYKKFRERWGEKTWLYSIFYIFVTQALVLWFMAFPILLVNKSRLDTLSFSMILGVLVWIVGFFFETVGDYQLLQFKKNLSNKNKIMKEGLWQYTRHPNYFGEATMWWGIFIFSLSAPGSWIGIVSPALITLLLLRISGVTMTEKKYENDLQYKIYKEETSAFIPMPPRKVATMKQENQTMDLIKPEDEQQ